MEKQNFKETLIHGTPAFPIAVYNNSFDMQYNLLAPLHYHNEFELLVATKGSLSVQIEETLYTISEGQGLFINSGLIHMISSADNCDHGFIAVVFDPGLISTEYDISFKKYFQPIINGTLTVPVLLPATACSLIHAVKDSFENSSFGFELYTKYALLQIFHLFVQNAKPTSLPVQNTKSLLIKNVLDFIEANYSDNISLRDMANHTHVSSEYLCRIFNLLSDTTPLDYLNRYRIRKSTGLLIHTGNSIAQIASSCGFNNSSYFNKLFLRYMGCTPSAYRKHHTDNQQ